MKNSDATGILTALAALCLCFLAAACAHDTAGPPGAGNPAVEGALGIYTGPLNHLHAVRRGNCPMHPSCSAYSRQAIDRFGWARGWVMSADRLMRCGRDEMQLAPKVWVDGHWKHYDPVDGNDFWHERLVGPGHLRRAAGDTAVQ